MVNTALDHIEGLVGRDTDRNITQLVTGLALDWAGDAICIKTAPLLIFEKDSTTPY